MICALRRFFLRERHLGRYVTAPHFMTITASRRLMRGALRLKLRLGVQEERGEGRRRERDRGRSIPAPTPSATVGLGPPPPRAPRRDVTGGGQWAAEAP